MLIYIRCVKCVDPSIKSILNINKEQSQHNADLRSFDMFDWFVFRKNPSFPLRGTVWHASQNDFGYLQPGGPKADCTPHWCKWYLKRSTIDIPYGIVFLISDILDMPVVFSETRMWFRRENGTPWILSPRLYISQKSAGQPVTRVHSPSTILKVRRVPWPMTLTKFGVHIGF